MTMIDDVYDFHRFFGHTIGKRPQLLPMKRMENRLKWGDEERQEYKDAIVAGDMVEVADAIVDQIYFLLGDAIEMGIPIQRVWDVIHQSNMDKACYPRHHRDCPLREPQEKATRCECGAVQYKEDGKTAKPEEWVPPTEEIRQLLAQAGHEG